MADLNVDDYLRRASRRGATFRLPSIPDVGPPGTATNRAQPTAPYPMGGLFGPAFSPSTNPAIPTVAAPVSPDMKTDNPVRDAIVEQLIRQSGQGGESGFNDPGLGFDTSDTPDVATPAEATPTTGPFGEDSAGSGKGISPAEANQAAAAVAGGTSGGKGGVQGQTVGQTVGQPMSLAQQHAANMEATKNDPEAQKAAQEMFDFDQAAIAGKAMSPEGVPAKGTTTEAIAPPQAAPEAAPTSQAPTPGYATVGQPGEDAPGAPGFGSGVAIGNVAGFGPPGISNAPGAISGFGTATVGAPGSVTGFGVNAAPTPGLMPGQMDAVTANAAPPAAPAAPAAPTAPGQAPGTPSPTAAQMAAAHASIAMGPTAPGVTSPISVTPTQAQEQAIATPMAALADIGVPGFAFGMDAAQAAIGANSPAAVSAAADAAVAAAMGTPGYGTIGDAPEGGAVGGEAPGMGGFGQGALGGASIGFGGLGNAAGTGGTAGLAASPGPAGTPGATVGAPGSIAGFGVNAAPVGYANVATVADAIANQAAMDSISQAAQNAADDAAADAGDDGEGGDGGEGGE